MHGRFPQLEGALAINDASGLGTVDAARKANRSNFPVTAVDGAPEAVQAGVKILNGRDLVQMAASW